MSIFSDIKGALNCWIEAVARTFVGMRDRLTSPRSIRLIEQANGAFMIEAMGPASASLSDAVHIHIADGGVTDSLAPGVKALIKGSRAEIVLQPGRFLFRPLELPRRANEFLEGIVRSQIDRLTPWSAKDALFGCTRPTDIAGDRIALTVVATGRTVVAPYIQAITGLGAQSVAVFTRGEDEEPLTSITLGEQATQGGRNLPGLQRALLSTLLIAIVSTAIIAAATIIIGYDFQGQQDAISQRIAERRAAMRAGHEASGGTAAARHALEQRKRKVPSSVIIIDVLSKILPDYTYLTELHVEGNKLQIVGMTHDAPLLIPLIEHSPHFTRATFFAPTTRATNVPGERFHIEARILPVFTHDK
jgi:general secretion pathway protein L